MARESRAIPKMLGMETEFGIIAPWYLPARHATAQFFRDLQEKRLLNDRTFDWDPHERLRGRDAETDEYHGYLLNPAWIEYENFLLPDGSRFYRDGSHPELSTPISSDPKMLVVWNRAGYRFIDLLKKELAALGRPYRIFRNNVGYRDDGRPGGKIEELCRNSYGSHLNVCVARRVSLEELVKKFIPFFISLLPVCGAGKVGSDLPGQRADFQISQRADFMEQAIGSNTVENRPLFHLRDSPYADTRLFRRVHIIFFDSNMLELPEYLKAGLISILGMMVEDEAMDDRFEILDPVSKCREISRDTSLNAAIWLHNRRRSRKALDCLKEYCLLFWNYLENYHPQNEILKDAVIRLAGVLAALENRDWDDLFGKLDWVTKKILIEKKLARDGVGWQDPRPYQIDIDYHDNDHQGGLFYKVVQPCQNTLRITTDEEINRAFLRPPPTRAAWITKTVERYRNSVASSDYYYRITFRDPERVPPFQRIFFPDPGIPWDENAAQKLFSLPAHQFIAEAENLGLITTYREEDEDLS